MLGEHDFSRVHLKVNASGSWANVMTLNVDDYDRVKTACLTLAECAKTNLKFKLVDDAGGTLEYLEYDRSAYEYRWHSPRRAA